MEERWRGNDDEPFVALVPPRSDGDVPHRECLKVQLEIQLLQSDLELVSIVES